MRPDSIFAGAEDSRKGSRYKEALKLYKKAFAEYSLTGDSGGKLECLLSIGDTLRMIGDFKAAGSAYDEAATLCRKQKHSLLLADSFVGLGLSKRALGFWEEALALFNKAQKIYTKNADKEGTAFALWAAGGAYRVKGDLKQAIGAFRGAIKIYSGAGTDEEGMRSSGYCLCGLGGASRVAAGYEASMKYYMEANAIFKRLKDRFGTAYSHCGIGNAFRMKGDYKNALIHLNKAGQIYRSIGDIVSYSYTVWSLGMLHLMNSRLKTAEKYLRMAAALFAKTKDVRGSIYFKLSTGELMYLRGEKTAAKKAVTDALRLSEDKMFMLEQCHSKTLLNYINGVKNSSRCYKTLGSNLRFNTIPFNIP